MLLATQFGVLDLLKIMIGRTPPKRNSFLYAVNLIPCFPVANRPDIDYGNSTPVEGSSHGGEAQDWFSDHFLCWTLWC